MKNNNKYKYIHICYFSCLPYIDKEEYFETLDFYLHNEFDEQVLKEFEIFWSIIKHYVTFLNQKNLPIPFRNIVLRRDKEDFKEKMQKLYKSIEEIGKKLNLKIWQVKALIAFAIWRKNYTLKDLLEKVHEYCEEKVKEKEGINRILKGVLEVEKFSKNNFNKKS